MVATITEKIEIKSYISFANGDPWYGADGFVVSRGDDTWDDITEDVLDYSHDRGVLGNGPKDRVASPGKMDMELNNSVSNSGGVAGYYSPDNANLRPGFGIGAEIRVCYTFDGNTRYVWRGTIYDIQPDADPYTARTNVIAYDWMKKAQEYMFQSVTVNTDQRGDQALQTVIDSMPQSMKPDETSFDTGNSTFPYVFDVERDEKTSLMRVCQQIAMSEIGKIYVNSGNYGEQVVFENYVHGVTESTVQHDFDADIIDTEGIYRHDHVYTNVLAIAHPRDVDTEDGILAQLQTPTSVGAGDNKDITLRFRDPDTGERIGASSLAARVSGTDYIANASEDGSGANRTADMTVTVADVSSNSITLNVANGGATTFWITTLQQKGKGLYTYDPVSYESEAASAYRAQYGKNRLTYDLPYEDDYAIAVNTAERLIETWKDPICLVKSLTYIPSKNDTLAQAFIDIDIGKRITVNVTQWGIDQDYFVHSERVERISNVISVSYLLIPATSPIVCILNDTTYGVLNSSVCKLA